MEKYWNTLPPSVGSVICKKGGYVHYTVEGYDGGSPRDSYYAHLRNSHGELEYYEFRGKVYTLVSGPPSTEQTQTNQKGTDMTTLYKITDEAITKELGETYCTTLAKDSAGNYVVEVKGHAGKVLSVRPEYLEEVVPYTVSVKFLAGNGQTYHYISQEGKVKVGDFVWVDSTSGLAVVNHVNTKSKQATKELTGRRVLTEEL